MAYEFIEKYKDKFPSLVKAFKEDLDALLNHLRLPFRHRKYVRTTNLVKQNTFYGDRFPYNTYVHLLLFPKNPRLLSDRPYYQRCTTFSCYHTTTGSFKPLTKNQKIVIKNIVF